MRPRTGPRTGLHRENENEQNAATEGEDDDLGKKKKRRSLRNTSNT